jgi:hypothetical protein
MARAKKRSEPRPEVVSNGSWLGSLSGLIRLRQWLPGLDSLTGLFPSRALPEWMPLASRAEVAELHDRLVRLERRLAEHERAHAPTRPGQQSLSA